MTVTVARGPGNGEGSLGPSGENALGRNSRRGAPSCAPRDLSVHPDEDRVARDPERAADAPNAWDLSARHGLVDRLAIQPQKAGQLVDRQDRRKIGSASLHIGWLFGSGRSRR